MSTQRVDLRPVRHRLVKAPQRLSEGFARGVRNMPERWLEEILRTPVRRVVVEGIIWQMPQHLDRKRAVGMSGTIRWRITDRGAGHTYELEFDDGRCRVRRGEAAGDPRVTITLDTAEFVRLATGNSDPIKAYFGGRVALAGDIVLAAKLQSLFRIPGATQSRQPRSTVSSSR